MKTQLTPSPRSHRVIFNWIIRIGTLVGLIALIGIPLFSSSSASSAHQRSGVGTASTPTAVSISDRMLLKRESVRISDPLFKSNFSPSSPLSLMLPQSSELFGAVRVPTTLLPQFPAPETIATFEVVAGVCTATPKNSFNLGETVCAIVTGAPLGTVDRAARSIAWVSPYGSLAQGAEITTDPQTGYYAIPTAATQTFTDDGGGTVIVDNRGTWRVGITSASDGSLREAALFTVHDPTKAFVDLSVNQSVTVLGSQVNTGSGGVFEIFVTNSGPDAAQDVVLSDTFSDNITFSSALETPGGPGFTCNTPIGNVFTCTVASMPAGSKAHLTFAYMVNADTPAGAAITNDVSVSSSVTPCAPDTTCELQPNDNSSNASAEVPTAVGGQTCALNCHENMSVLANATQGGSPGAFVTFGAASGSGNCGAITATPASGTFFAVGTRVVNVTSETGSGSCSFTVTVVPGTPPSITCPANITVTAALNATSATVNPGTPVTNPSTGVTVVGLRSDDPVCTEGDNPGCASVPVTAPYPLGTTTIRWFVTNSNGLSASCTQRITVNENNCGGDTTPPTITAPPAVTFGTGPDNDSCTVALDDELGSICTANCEPGQPTATDNCTVSVSVTGIPTNNAFPIGTTTVTYTATDGAGNQASATQLVTVFDNTPPVIAAPPDATYTCLSEVPAANPSQATRGQVFDENGNLLPPGPPFDNCGVPTVTVTESSTGAGSAADPRIITRIFTATDTSPAHNSSSATQIITVIDSQPPTITDPADVTAYTGPGAASCDTTVTLGTPVTGDNCAGVNVTRSPSGNTFLVGTTEVVWTATDAAGNTATVSQNVTVNDNTLPTITAPADKTLYTGAGATSCSVTVSDLNATLGTATAADNCPGVTWVRGGGNVFPLGETTVTYTATDAHGNTASVTQKVTVVDNTPPVVTPPANITVYLPLNSSATSMAISYPNPATATDNCAGSITFSYSPASGSTFSVGTTTVTATATDAHSNSASATFTVTVLYNFTGFFSPVNNLPTLNSVNAGRAIPVKFSLSGNKGLNIFAPNNPYSVSFNCDTSDPGVDIAETNTAGGSSLSYSPDQYHYNWKTEGSWAGTCRQLVITLNDGSVHTANFKFR